MRRISLSPRSDALVIQVGRDRARALAFGAAFLGAASVLALLDGSGVFGTLWLMGCLFALPALAVGCVRALSRRERTLVRSHGRLVLDGDPLELARIELKVMHLPITRVPTGYAVSLWMLTATGPEDLPLGHCRTLVEASALSGQLEDFVQKASVNKLHRHA